MIRLFSHSLSLRLLAIFLLMGVLFALGAYLGVRWVYVTDDLRELISGHLSLHVEYVRNDIGDPPRIDRAIAITNTVPVDIRIEGPDLSWASHDAFPALSEITFGGSQYFGEQPDAWLNELQDVEFAIYQGHRMLKLKQGPYDIVVASPKIGDVADRPPLMPIIMGFGLLLVLLAYLAVRWLFRPIGAIREGAARIGRGELEHRIGTIRRDELGDLAADINNMANDVQRMLDAKRQLLLGISHELRSPLSRLRLSLEFLNETGEREALRTEIDEMERIIATLLEAERLNTRHAALHLSEVSIRELIDGLIDDFFSRSRDRISVSCDLENDRVVVDEARIVLLLKNLLSNALRYSGESDGPVEVLVSDAGNGLSIRVRDHGPGIPEEQVERLGEPFFRGDPSRTRGTGGTGLGLYLAKLVAEAHGGTLRLVPEFRGGACFEVALPTAPGR